MRGIGGGFGAEPGRSAGEDGEKVAGIGPESSGREIGEALLFVVLVEEEEEMPLFFESCSLVPQSGQLEAYEGA